jgi:hypothetical protein
MNPLNTISDVQTAANLTASIVQQAVVSPLGNPYTIGISGLIFDIVDVVDMQIESESTDNVVEQNFTVQDHVVQKPIIITMKGYAAEQVSVFNPNSLSAIFSQVAGLVPLVGLAPTFNTQDSQFYSTLLQTAQLAQNAVNSLQSLYQLFTQSGTTVTRQQSVFGFLINLRNTNTLCTVETPWAIFYNMIIQSIRPLQSGETVFVSEFIVTFKQILTVSSIQGTVNTNSVLNANSGTQSLNNLLAGGSFQQISASSVENGNDNGTATDDNGNDLTVGNTLESTYAGQLAQ